MSLKSKLITLSLSICLVVVALMVGVFAIRQVDDFDVGGDIGFTATGINATISSATLTNLTSSNSSRMQSVTINTGHSAEDVNALFASWRNLDLAIKDGQTSATITFTVKNNSTESDNYIILYPEVNYEIQNNLNIDARAGKFYVAPNSTSTVTITINPSDIEEDGHLSNFKINWSLEYGVATPEAEVATNYSYTLNSPTGEATISKFNSTTLTEIVVPTLIKGTTDGKIFPVTTLGDSCFASKTQLVSVELPKTLKTLGSSAFSSCTSLSKVNIPKGITELQYTFNNCTSLTSIKIPYGVTSLGGSATFSSCSALESIEIPDSVTSLGFATFSYCTSLKSIKLSKNLIRIDYWAFSNCSSLKSLVVPNSVTSFGAYNGMGALDGCTSLESLTMPFLGYSITDTEYNFIGTWFGGSSYSDHATVVPESLKEVIVTGGTTIAASAFRGCANIERVVLPDTLTTLPNYTFRDCTSLASVRLGENITSIGTYAFYNCKELTDILIPESVTSIGTNVFYTCSSLTNLVIPENVITIGSNSLRYCSKLATLTIPFVGNAKTSPSYTNFGYIFGTTSYSSNSSYVPTSLKSVYVTGGTSVAANAFYNCSSITTLSLPDTITSLGAGAFTGCNALINLSIPFVGTSISAHTRLSKLFGSDSNGTETAQDASIPTTLKTLTITKATTIGEFALEYITSLTTINLPDTLTSIEKYSFRYLTSLKTLTIPESVTDLDEASIFRKCSSLTEVNLPNTMTSIGGYTFHSCSALQTLVIPDSVTQFIISPGQEAYPIRTLYQCSKLVNLTIPFVGNTLASPTSTHFSVLFGNDAGAYSNVPSTLTTLTVTGGTIYTSAFTGCTKITSLTLGEGVNCATGISDLTGLTTLISKANVPPILNAALPLSLRSIKVPSASVSVYKASSYWSNKSSNTTAI